MQSAQMVRNQGTPSRSLCMRRRAHRHCDALLIQQSRNVRDIVEEGRKYEEAQYNCSSLPRRKGNLHRIAELMVTQSAQEAVLETTLDSHPCPAVQTGKDTRPSGLGL